MSTPTIPTPPPEGAEDGTPAVESRPGALLRVVLRRLVYGARCRECDLVTSDRRAAHEHAARARHTVEAAETVETRLVPAERLAGLLR